MLDFKSLSDDRLTELMGSFVEKLKSHASDLGVSNYEVEKADHEYRTISGMVSEDKRVQQSNVDPQIKQEFSKYKDLIKNGPDDDLKQKFPSVFTPTATETAPGVIPRIQQFVQSLTQRTGFSPDIAQKLGIAGLGAGAISGAMANQGQFAEWLSSFVNGLKEHKTDLNVSDGEMESLNKDYHTTKHLVTETDRVRTEGASGGVMDKLMSYKNMIINGPSDGLKSAFPGALGMLAAVAPGIVPRFSGLIDRLKTNPKFNDLVGKDLGITEAAGGMADRARTAAGAGAAGVAGAASAAGGRSRETVSSGAGYGSGPGGRQDVEPAPKRNWLWPVLGLIALGLLAWGLSSRQSGYWMGAKAPQQQKATAPAGVGAGPSKAVPKRVAPVPVPAKGVGTPSATVGRGATSTTVSVLKISDMRFTPNAKGGILMWKTNKPSTSQIQLGKTDSYEMGMAPRNVARDKASMVTEHRVGLTGLPTDKYYVKARSIDASGHEAVSEPYSFTLR